MREHDQDADQTVRNLDRLTGAILDGRYRIDEKLAAGGFGAIYRATDLVMGREVALKVLHRELAHDSNVVERFRREASALAKLRDPHTITMYDVGQAPDGTRYIVMELLRGMSLHELFHESGKRLPWRRVVAIARGVCSSLREAHSVGLVHRDLKPANIHLERHPIEADYVKVLDFGIAKMIDTVEPNRNLTHAGQMIGTFDYMPPEQMIGGMTSGKSDVFTLGVVIYEMIAGERPYGEATGPASRLMTLLGTTPTPLAQRAPVPAELDRIIMRAIEKDPELRPDIFELDAELACILDQSNAEDARFLEDGPTWIEPVQPQRITPLRVSNPTRTPRRVHVPDTLLGTAAKPTPSHGVPIVPRPPATPTPSSPVMFPLGTRTKIAQAPDEKEPNLVSVYAPPQDVDVRFTPQPFARQPAMPVLPQRLPVGTKSPVKTEPKPAHSWGRQAAAAFFKGVLVAILLVAMAWTLVLVA
jgi:serine/threonine-protein kinase